MGGWSGTKKVLQRRNCGYQSQFQRFKLLNINTLSILSTLSILNPSTLSIRGEEVTSLLKREVEGARKTVRPMGKKGL
jgi:hypothetical protein